MSEVPDHVAILQADDIRDAPHVRAANGRTGRNYAHVDECYVCGRGLTEDALAKGWWVHVLIGGQLVANDLGPVDDDEDLGWAPVGSGCVKRVPRRFRERLDP